ncbi:ATP-binding cassette domain-containing protein [Daejeonella sp.]|uniref:ABC transporter ATP-binding protein n=1 Tax=Daejeonella sp. TaxID=2805397 RepID=UPI0026868E12|nr:ATP-binding cassette domain-containing protein [Daejeonella sp.]HQT24856.1 ATP-binding cassette domain-containing protein [Daejeonella sp.]HQT59035.1 ATP-binding cassette domain-containing protein [Daejeonella sp.]
MKPELIIETRNLSYQFGNQLVLDRVSLNVREGSIYGFLGPNGAGKTTTIKVLLNLLQAEKGKVFLFGKDLNKNRIEILSGIGSLIEQPAIYSHLSGRENLLNRALLLQVHSVKVHEMLDLVNLTEHADKKAGQYSLGMKQRLGIALALLHDPKLLILDEPTNGLDPNGIIEIRQLIRKLVQERAKTVFISSHLLTEVEKMVTHIGIINRGKLLFQGTIEELHNVSKKNLEIQTNDLVRSRELLCKNGYQAEILSDLILIPYLSENQSAEINSLLVKHDHRVYSLTISKQNLENLFLSITQI